MELTITINNKIMEKEKYGQLSPEEVKEFEEQNMTEKQREKSDERDATFEAGKQAVAREMQERIENPYGLSERTRKLVESGNIRIGTSRYEVYDRYGMISFDDYNGTEVPDECIIECIEKIDDAVGIFVEFMKRPITNKDIVTELLNKGLKNKQGGACLILGLSYQPELHSLIADMKPELEKNLQGARIHISEDQFTMVKGEIR